MSRCFARLLPFVFPFCLVRAQAPLYDPAPAPDRPEIAFVSGGDIWRVASSGGEASLLVSHPATESRPLFSPDGKRLAFVSTRTGGGDIYVLDLQTRALKRITFDDAPDNLDSWSANGEWLYFHSAGREISAMNDVFRVKSSGGAVPMPVLSDRYTNEFFAAPSPDDSTIAFTARGVTATQWWRNGHSHLDECELWMYGPTSTGARGTYQQLTPRGAKHVWPMWSPDGKRIFYMSDEDGAENLWSLSPGVPAGKPQKLTQFRDGRLLFPRIAADGKTIYFERNFGIWKFDTAKNTTSEIAITLRGAMPGPAITRQNLTQFEELSLSPDGKKVAIVARGEIFAASAADGGDAQRVTESPAPDDSVVWAPDSRRLAFESGLDGYRRIQVYDFASRSSRPISSSTEASYNPQFSPDGKRIAYLRGGKSLRVIDLESNQDKELAAGMFELPPVAGFRTHVWSPDGKFLAYLSEGIKGFDNAFIVAADGASPPQQVSFLANGFASNLVWSPDGDSLLFSTGQRTEISRIARIHLRAKTPPMREEQFAALFEPEKKDAKKNVTVTIDFDGIRQRAEFLALGMEATSPAISPDGKTLLFESGSGRQQQFFTFSIDPLSKEPPVARQLTSSAGPKSFPQFSPDGKQVFFLEGGRIQSITVESRVPKPLAVTAELVTDFDKQKMQVFRQAWTIQRDNFYDEKMHGVDWVAVRERFEPRVQAAASTDELRRLLNLMVGELNASHLGASAGLPQGGPNPETAGIGRLGLDWDRAAYESAGSLKVSNVVPLGPAALGGIKTGESITAIDGVALTAGVNADEALQAKAGRRVMLTVEGGSKRDVAVRAISMAAEKRLRYRQWVEDNRAYVEKASGGRLGYVHMFDMGADSLEQLHVDLDAAMQSKEGVVVDVRNNNGGFVNVYAIDVLARRSYFNMTRRGGVASPSRPVLGQRALDLPTILVTNQHSLSDAEDFTQGYRLLKLGKVVGEPTSGWIIYTWNTQLVDGTSFRLPRMKITDDKGQNMERNPRPVDTRVERPLGEASSGKDSQLDESVKQLLAQLSVGRQEKAGQP